MQNNENFSLSGVNDVKIPDRFEMLARETSESLSTIIVPVDSALEEVDSIFKVMRMSDRGAFAILRGNSGAGKTTFLHTIHLYRQSVASFSIPGNITVTDYLENFSPESDNLLNIIVLEEREAAISFTDQELESWLHSINAFIRKPSGKTTLIVWPCNSDALQKRLEKLSLQIGGKSLLGSRSSAILFAGPDNDLHPEIASRTLGAINQGAGLSDFGLTADDVSFTAKNSSTIGDFLGDVRDLIIKRQNAVASLLVREQPKMWVVVIAGNEPASDVSGLTRSSLSLVDMDRLMTSTDANIVKNLKKMPEKLGILATVLNAKILHFPVLAATASIRAFADDKLTEKLRKNDFLVTRRDPLDSKKRILDSEFGSVIALGKQKTLVRGKKLGDKSRKSFEKLAQVASDDDAAVNRALGNALVACKIVDSFEVEVSLPGKYSVRSDLLVKGKFGEARLEIMWRSRTGRADIANYTLKKLENYGKNIGLLQ